MKTQEQVNNYFKINKIYRDEAHIIDFLLTSNGLKSPEFIFKEREYTSAIDFDNYFKKEQNKLCDFIYGDIDCTDFSNRIKTCLKNHEIKQIIDLLKLPNINYLLRFRNFAKKSYKEMVAKIDYYNKQFNSNLYIGMTQEEIYEEIKKFNNGKIC